MNLFIRNALLGAAGLVVLSVSAQAAGSTAVTDTPVLKAIPRSSSLSAPTIRAPAASASRSEEQQTAQRRDDPSAGSVGFKKSKKKKAKK